MSSSIGSIIIIIIHSNYYIFLFNNVCAFILVYYVHAVVPYICYFSECKLHAFRIVFH